MLSFKRLLRRSLSSGIAEVIPDGVSPSCCSVAAYCRNSVDGQWYSYDDSSVDLVPEEEVCTRGAYILFYQRRNTIPPWSASSSIWGMRGFH